MSNRDRIATVLRVRRVQELQAAGELAGATAAAREAERALGAIQRHYDRHRDLDGLDDVVPESLRIRERRDQQAAAIRRGREQVRAALARVDERRADLQLRSQAVKAMERLDERLAGEARAETERAERREVDDRSSTLAARARA